MRDTTHKQEVDRIIGEIHRWLSSKRPIGVDVRRDDSPAEQDQDYEVVYELTLSPNSLEKAFQCISISSKGGIGIGIERWERIARRLGLQWGGRRYVEGFEPRTDVRAREILETCDLIYNGRFKITAYALGRRLIGCVLVTAAANEPLRSFGMAHHSSLLNLLARVGVVREIELSYVSCDDAE